MGGHGSMDCVCTVVGAGVVGLAVARSLSKLFPYSVLVLESETGIGQGTSSRNSEVIHAGLYYPPGSLKAKLCREGNLALYQFAQEAGVSHSRCGKLLVATRTDQHSQLKELARTAAANGVSSLRWLSAADVRHLEPEVVATGGLLSPETGIIDSHALMLALQGEAEADGATVCLGTPVTGGRVEADGTITLHTPDTSLRTSVVVNCAGLHAGDLAASIDGVPPPPPLHFAKGNYFSLSPDPACGVSSRPFNRLIYPLPERAGLGVHATIDLAGTVRFGPDVQWLEGPPKFSMDYAVDVSRADAFYEAVRRYWPALPDGALAPAYAGVRPKLHGPAGAAAAAAPDFLIEHAAPGWVALYGIESPGLTAALAIGDYVARLVEDAS